MSKAVQTFKEDASHDRESELKACPILIAAQHQKSAYCVSKDCAWWCEAAGKCSVAVMGEDAWNRRVGEGEKG